MKIRLSKPNEQALRLYLTGELTDIDLIAVRVNEAPSQVATWMKDQRWARLRRQVRRSMLIQLLSRLQVG